MTETMKGALWCALFLLIAGLTLGLLAGCSDSQLSITGPTGPTGPPGPDDPIDDPVPEVPKTKPFSWARYRGFSGFAMSRLSSREVERSYSFAKQRGYNTARVCAELEDWDNGQYFPTVPKNIDQVREFLTTVSGIKGAQVLLVPICTIRNRDPERQDKWLSQVLEVADDFNNVAIEFVNEPWHQGSKTTWPVIEGWYRKYKRIYPTKYFGADDHWGEFHRGHELAGVLDFLSFHPARDRNGKPWDPSFSELQTMVNMSGGMAVLSETVSWHFTNNHPFGALVTTDKQRVVAYKNRCLKTAGCRWTFHSVEGLDGRKYTWMP